MRGGGEEEEGREESRWVQGRAGQDGQDGGCWRPNK
jgi:hypothetical protein